MLVPLNHRALRHGCVLDRHQIVHRLVPEQKSAGMDRQVTRKVEDLVGELEQMFMEAAGEVEPHLLEDIRPHILIR